MKHLFGMVGLVGVGLVVEQSRDVVGEERI